jgi:hypothetical protein
MCSLVKKHGGLVFDASARFPSIGSMQYLSRMRRWSSKRPCWRVCMWKAALGSLFEAANQQHW